jgi:uncharacterized membrane protein
MNREMFLERLREELKGVSHMEASDILADFTEYFRDAEAAGRSDIDVAKALGSPVQLAAALRGNANTAWRPVPSSNPLARRLASVIALFFLNIVLAVPVIAVAIATLLSLYLGAFFVILAGGALLITCIPGHPFTGFVKLDIFGVSILSPTLMGLSGVGMLLTGMFWTRLDNWLARRLGEGVGRYVRFNIRFARGH